MRYKRYSTLTTVVMSLMWLKTHSKLYLKYHVYFASQSLQPSQHKPVHNFHGAVCPRRVRCRDVMMGTDHFLDLTQDFVLEMGTTIGRRSRCCPTRRHSRSALCTQPGPVDGLRLSSSGGAEGPAETCTTFAPSCRRSHCVIFGLRRTRLAA